MPHQIETIIANAANPSRAEQDLLDTSTDCIKVVGLDGSLLGMNTDGMCLMEIEDFSMVRGKAWADLWPEPHRLTISAAVSRALNGSVARFSADCPTAKGTPKHWDVIVSPVHDDSGSITHLLSISRDVTREVQIAGERALVTRELAHRIKNLFAIVDGMIGLSARTAKDTKSFAQSLRDRLSGLARSVAYIYESAPTPAGQTQTRTVHNLVRDLMEPYARERGASVVIVGDDQPISEDAVTPLALIFNELSTNALKYGALKLSNGSLIVSTRLVGKTYHLKWAEAGDRVVTDPQRGGFGTTLIDRTTMLQLAGRVTRTWGGSGVEIQFEFPVQRLV